MLQPQPLEGDPAAPHIQEVNVVFRPSSIQRHIVVPPAGATWGVLRLVRRGGEAAARFLVHAMQLAPRRSCRAHDTHRLLALAQHAPAVAPFRVLVSALATRHTLHYLYMYIPTCTPS